LRRSLDIGADRDVVVYPGDLEFGGGAERVAQLVAPLRDKLPNVVVVFACRQKTAAAGDVLRKIQDQLNPDSVRFAGELPSLPTLLALSRLVVFPVEQLFAKVDIPIALLEAMSLGVPLVVPTEGPVAELVSAERVPLQDNVAWVRACTELLSPGPMWEMIRTRQRVQLESEFAAKVVAARYEDLYQQVLDQR
jgi:phosphatidylinositol alpha-1,6-mannosyltransferase